MRNYGRTLIKKSLLIISSIMGLIFAVAMFIAWKHNMNLAYALLIPLSVVLFQFLISPAIIGMLYSIEFESTNDFLSEEVIRFLKDTCREINIPVPRLGIIKDGNPNAFTYGHFPKNARLVLTAGLIDVLTEDELKAVIAHELGHIKHYDFILMTLVSLIPLVLYQIYIWTKNKDKSKPEYWVGISSYIVYILSQYVVLSFSRVREYYADNFAKELVKNGEDLKNALIKIAYGLTSIKKSKNPRVSTLSFTNNLQNEALLLGNYKLADRTIIQEKLLKWDMNNLWARWYEIHSTHPITSKRVLALKDEYTDNNKPDLKHISLFLFEVFINILPWTVGITTLAFNISGYTGEFKFYSFIFESFTKSPLLILLLGASILIKYYYSYSGNFKATSIIELLEREDASPVRGIPAVLKAKVIGKGVPGLIFSEDVVVDDETGIMLVDYRQPGRIFEFLFGIFKADKLIGSNVEVIGWYKRGIRPYFVCRNIIESGKKITSFNYVLNRIFGYVVVLTGIILSIMRFVN